MADKPSVIRDTDDEARKLARSLIHTVRHAALAVIEPEGGFPSASRVLLATDSDGTPTILVSALSAHTKALEADARASLLTGEPGKGDPLAYPRLTMLCLAEGVERDTPAHRRIRQRFLNRHPKAKLYIDFPDFRFFRLVPQSASLNGGFGRAYLLAASDLLHDAAASESLAAEEAATIAAIEALAPDVATELAVKACGAKAGDWRISGLDSAGLDLVSADEGVRLEYEKSLPTQQDIIYYISKMVYSIREI